MIGRIPLSQRGVVHALEADDRYRFAVEDPVVDVDGVCAHLEYYSAALLLNQSPVRSTGGIFIRRRHAPIAAVGIHIRREDLSNLGVADRLHRHLVALTVTPLRPDL